MATQRQLAANRANAQKSTGPRSLAGKAASATNALKSGIYSRSPLLPGEDPAEYQAFVDDHYSTFRPANADERQLLEMMISNRWIARRLEAAFHQQWTWSLENDATSPDQRPHIPLVRTYNRNEDHFVKVTRMLASLDRAFHRSRTALLHAQKARQATVQPVAPKPASPKLASFRQKTPQAVRLATIPAEDPASPTPASQPPTPVPSHSTPSPVQRW